MKYAGIFPTSQVPGTCIHRELHHTEKVHGKEVKYWECWVKDPDEIQPIFQENAEPDRAKIRKLDKLFRK